MRLDQRVAAEFSVSKSKAQDLIHASRIKVNNTVVTRKAQLVSDDDRITKIEQLEFVSRSGFKLYHALLSLNLDLHAKIVLDIGSSTGGFSECCLMMGASHVYAVDVGFNQLHPKLRGLDTLTSKEGFNAKELTPETFGRCFEVIVCDVSFISITQLFANIASVSSDHADILLLFKPQFECGPQALNKHGVVKNLKLVQNTIDRVIAQAALIQLIHVRTLKSEVVGRSGNQEYILYFKKEGEPNA